MFSTSLGRKNAISSKANDEVAMDSVIAASAIRANRRVRNGIVAARIAIASSIFCFPFVTTARIIPYPDTSLGN